jgi:Flp pilus assembly CpaE family ATPase
MNAVLLAAADIPAEPELVSALSASRSLVVRRCVDAVDLLGAATTGGADIAIVSSALPRLSADVVRRLHAADLRVIGVHVVDDLISRESLERLGVTEVVTVRLGDVTAAIEAVHRHQSRQIRLPEAQSTSRGRVVAVWGPYGSPGRTTTTVALADEYARRAASVMLIDADPFGGAVGSHLGMLDESSGLIAACRRADQGTLDLAGLARSARSLSRELRVLTGIDAPDRWTHVRPAALERVLRLAREAVDVTVVDAGFCLDEGSDINRCRTAATTTVIAEADAVVAVVAADHVGIGRLAAAWPALQELASDRPVHVVVNRVRSRAVGRDAIGQIDEALRRLCGITETTLVADDPETCDTAIRDGRTIAELAPRSAPRVAFTSLADRLGAVGAPKTITRESAA